MSDAETSAFASFEEKWLTANPEQATVALFLAPAARLRAAAFGCLVHELEQAAFGLREPHIAEVKIQWWRQEMLAAASGKPRHPLSAVLFADPQTARVDAASWAALSDGALGMLQAGLASDLDSLLAGFAAMYGPMARIEAALFDLPPNQAQAAARAAAISHVLQTLRHLPDAAERLPVPLDLLARHAMTRSALGEPGARRAELLRDFLRRLGAALHAALNDATPAPLGRRVRARLDLVLIRNAQHAADPLPTLMQQPGAARWKALWWSWREARRAAA